MMISRLLYVLIDPTATHVPIHMRTYCLDFWLLGLQLCCLFEPVWLAELFVSVRKFVCMGKPGTPV